MKCATFNHVVPEKANEMAMPPWGTLNAASSKVGARRPGLASLEKP
jgi:hypothetical protein